MTTEQTAGILVTARDLLNGETGTEEIPPGEYVIVCAKPCYVANVHRDGNGTVLLMIKNHQPRVPSAVSPEAPNAR